MSAVKARWKSYNQLRSMLTQVPNDYKLFKLEDFQPTLRQLVEEWKLDRQRLSEISGLPPMVIDTLLGWSKPRSRQQDPRNPDSQLSLAPDMKKLLNGLIAWISPEQEPVLDDLTSAFSQSVTLRSLGPRAKSFVDGAALAVAALEAELCNITKTNQVEPLSDIASTLGRMERLIPSQGVVSNVLPDPLVAELERLHSQVASLTAERDRLYELLKSTVSSSPLKSGFLQQVGALPVVAASAAVGVLLGPEAIKSMMDYVSVLVATSSG